MRFNPKARLDRSRIGDAGGSSGGGSGGPMRIPMPGGTRAGGGIGGVLIIILLFVLIQCVGGGLPGGGSGTDTGQQPTQPGTDTSRMGDAERYANCKTGADANNDQDCARVAVENSLYSFWSADFQKDGQKFTPAKVETFTGSIQTGCGNATSQVGPFYCPNDQVIYLDTTFFTDIYQGQLGGKVGPFVEPYVIGHEYGHHIQNLTGIMGRVRTQQGANSDSVKLELQADCFAGAWAAGADGTRDSTGTQPIFSDLTDQDIQEAISAAATVGDDRIQKKTQGRVDPDSWTHGSAEQRVAAFKTGYQGTPNDCLPIGPQ